MSINNPKNLTGQNLGQPEKMQGDTTSRDNLVSTASSFLESKGEPILHQEVSEDGLGFETKSGKFFIPNYSFEFVSAHPELLTRNGVAWKKIEDIDYDEREERYFSGELLDKGEVKHLFRKDSSTKSRETDLNLGFPIQESRNSVHLGGEKSIQVSEQVSFRVPAHYATTPHGVIMEYLKEKTVQEFIADYEEQDRELILGSYRKLASFLSDFQGTDTFFISYDPIERYAMGARMVYVESYDKESGKIQFIITDLKNRNDSVPWEKDGENEELET